MPEKLQDLRRQLRVSLAGKPISLHDILRRWLQDKGWQFWHLDFTLGYSCKKCLKRLYACWNAWSGRVIDTSGVCRMDLKKEKGSYGLKICGWISSVPGRFYRIRWRTNQKVATWCWFRWAMPFNNGRWGEWLDKRLPIRLLAAGIGMGPNNEQLSHT